MITMSRCFGEEVSCIFMGIIIRPSIHRIFLVGHLGLPTPFSSQSGLRLCRFGFPSDLRLFLSSCFFFPCAGLGLCGEASLQRPGLCTFIRSSGGAHGFQSKVWRRHWLLGALGQYVDGFFLLQIAHFDDDMTAYIASSTHQFVLLVPSFLQGNVLVQGFWIFLQYSQWHIHLSSAGGPFER